jgi:hypothetical protein
MKKTIIEINFKESDNYTAIKSVIDTLQNNLNTENVDKWFILPKLKGMLEDEYYCIGITSLAVGIKLKDSSDMTQTSLISKDVLPYVSSITEIDSDFMETFKAIAFARFNEYVNLIADTYKGLYEYKLFDDDKLVLSNIDYTEYPYLSMILNDFDKFAHAMAEYKLWEKDQLYDENDNAYRKSYIKRQENVLNGLRFFD